MKVAAKNILKIVAENETARRLEVHLGSMNKTIQTPSYILSTNG